MDKKIEIAGKNIFYRVFGDGKPVMLVHGFGETGDVWKNQITGLGTNFQLIVPDLPGSGQSDMIDDMSMEGMAESLKTILDAENYGVSPSGKARVIMIGHSMGGYIALAFADKYSDYLAGLGLFHSTAFADSEEKKETRKKGIDFIHQHGAFEFLKSSTPNLFSPLSRAEKQELIDGFIRGLDNFSSQSLVSYYEAMMQRPDRTYILQIKELPILFLLGEYDNAVPLQDGLKQVHMPEKSYIHILHQSGHMGMLEEIDNSNHILNKFLSEI
jgi:pimeloyl-ACP methyl ester carboxylesterase